MKSGRILLAIVCIATQFCVAQAQAPGSGPGAFASIYYAGGATFEVDQIIGGDIEDDDTYLYRPSDLALDSHGNLFVLDAKCKCIKKFDAQGAHVTTFGRPGAGPGDLDRANQLEVDPDENVLVYDWRLRRFSLFGNDGKFLESVELNEMGRHRIDRMQVDARGQIWADVNVQESRYPEAPIPYRVSRLELEPFVETVIDSASFVKTKTLQVGDSTVYVGAPGAAGLYWRSTLDDRVVVANSQTGVIRIHVGDQGPIAEVSLVHPRQEFTSEDREEFFEKFQDGAFVSQLRRETKFPKFKPYFSLLHVDDEGHILLRVGEEEDGQALYEVRNPDGSYLGEVVLPRLARSAILTDGKIYNIKLHEESDYAIYRYVVTQ